MSTVNRPGAVSVLGSVLVLVAILSMVIDLSPPRWTTDLRLVALCGIAFTEGIGLLRGRRWAWMAARITAPFALVAALGSLVWALVQERTFPGHPLAELAAFCAPWPGIAAVLVLAFFNRPAARSFFLARREASTGDTSLPSVPTLESYREQLKEIERLVQKKRLKDARTLADRLVSELSARTGDASRDARETLGHAYLAQGSVLEAQTELADAAQSYLAARGLISLSAPSLTFLASFLAGQGKGDPEALEIYLDYLRVAKEEGHSAAEEILRVLKNLCQVRPEGDGQDLQTLEALNRRVLAADNRLGWTHYHLGCICYQRSRYEDALSELERETPPSDECRFLMARCHALLSRFASAVPLLTPLAVEGGHLRADALHYLGCAYANLGQLPEAIEAFTACLQVAPDRMGTALQRGHCRLAVNDLAGARQDYEAASKLQPDFIAPTIGLARCLLADGAVDAARSLLAPLGEAHPTHWELHMLRAAAAEKTGDPAEAEEAYQFAWSLDRSREEPRIRLGLLFSHLARHAEARDHLRHAMDSGHDSDSVLYHLGLALVETADPAGAVAVWQQLQARHPDDHALAEEIAELHYLTGVHHTERERYGDAVEAFGRHAGSGRVDEELQRGIAELHFRKALTELSAGNTRDARASLDYVGNAFPNHPGAQHYRAIGELLNGNAAHAAEQLEKLSAEQASAMGLRGRFHEALARIRMGEESRAQELLHSVAADPLSAELKLPAAQALAMLHMRQGRWEEALGPLQVESGLRRPTTGA